VTGEIAEYEAARLLGIELSVVRQAGYDAIRRTRYGEQRLQVKGRCLPAGAKRAQRIGRFDLQQEWDVALLVLLDDSFETTHIYEATRLAIETALSAPGSRARNKRGALAVSKFKSIGTLIWMRGATGAGADHQ
jgi:hypothetical protein